MVTTVLNTNLGTQFYMRKDSVSFAMSTDEDMSVTARVCLGFNKKKSFCTHTEKYKKVQKTKLHRTVA